MKKIIVLTLALIMSLSLCACGSEQTAPPATEATSGNETASSSATIPSAADSSEPTETTDAAQASTADTEEPTAEAQTEPQVIAESTREALQQAEILSANETVTADGLVKLTLENTYLTDEILPSAPGLSYNYIAGEDGYTYIVAQGSIENIGDKELDFNTFSWSNTIATLFIVDDATVYPGGWATEDSDGSSITARLAAGESANLYIFASIPDSIADSYQKISLLTGFCDFDSQVTDFHGSIDWNVCTYKYCFE